MGLWNFHFLKLWPSLGGHGGDRLVLTWCFLYLSGWYEDFLRGNAEKSQKIGFRKFLWGSEIFLNFRKFFLENFFFVFQKKFFFVFFARKSGFTLFEKKKIFFPCQKNFFWTLNFFTISNCSLQFLGHGGGCAVLVRHFFCFSYHLIGIQHVSTEKCEKIGFGHIFWGVWKFFDKIFFSKKFAWVFDQSCFFLCFKQEKVVFSWFWEKKNFFPSQKFFYGTLKIFDIFNILPTFGGRGDESKVLSGCLLCFSDHLVAF